MNRDNQDESLTPQQSARMIRDMHRALVGDPLNPDEEPGLVKTVNDLRNDVNGTKRSPLGMRQKVEILWEGRTKLVGMCVLVAVAGGFLAWLIPLLLNH